MWLEMSSLHTPDVHSLDAVCACLGLFALGKGARPQANKFNFFTVNLNDFLGQKISKGTLSQQRSFSSS